MRKTFKRAIATVMTFAMLPVVSFNVMAEEAEVPLSLNESFNSYITNDMPDSLDVNARNWYIDEHSPEDKGLAVFGDKGGSKISFQTASTGNTVISFDIKAINAIPEGQFAVKDELGATQTLLKFNGSKGVSAYNGLPVSGFGKNGFTNYTIIYRPGDAMYDIYVNGKVRARDIQIKVVSALQVSTIAFEFNSPSGDKGVILDNINTYASDKIEHKEFPVSEYNAEAYEKVDPAFGKQVGNRTLLDVTVEKPYSLYQGKSGNLIYDAPDPLNPENTTIVFEQTNPIGAHINGQGLPIESDSIIYEVDFLLANYDSIFNFSLKDSLAREFAVASIKKGPKIVPATGQTKTFKLNTWHRISAIVNYYDRYVEIYFDGEKIGTHSFANTQFGIGTNLLESFRIHFTQYADNDHWSEDDRSFIHLDNLRAYEGEKIIPGDLGEVIKEYNVKANKSIYPSDSSYKTMLSGFTSIHSTSGVVIVNGEKHLLRNLPIKRATNDFLLPAEELAKVLNVGYSASGNNIKFNNVAIKGEEHDGVIFADEDSLINALGKVVTKVPSTMNSNGVILGSMSFKLPEEQESIDALNDYLMYYRATPEQFDELYRESPLAGVHPKIQFTQADFDRMVALAETNNNMYKWTRQVISAADSALTVDLPKHEKYDGLRMSVQRYFSKNIHALAIAYHLTKDQRYLDTAYAHMKTIAEFPDWNPAHHLDHGEMMAAYGVGYDWLYNFFTPEQREVLEKGMSNNGFYDSVPAFQSLSTKQSNAYKIGTNHGIVCCGGAFVGAMAFYDAMPEAAAYVASNAMRGMEYCMYNWGPGGSWFEGAGYWELTMQFTAKFLSTCESVFDKTDFGWTNLDGLEYSAVTELQAQSPMGLYNYADAMPGNTYVPEMMYIANRYNMVGAYKSIVAGNDGKWNDPEDAALAVLWYHPEMDVEGEQMPIDYELPGVDTATLRNSWESKQPYYVGIHAGDTPLPHGQLDTGSFVYDADGVRWSMEFGMGDYLSQNYWDDGPGGDRYIHYRSRAEGHSTIFTETSTREDHKVPSHAELEITQSKPKGAIVTVDMSDTLFDVTKATRGFAFTDDRSSLVIRDEVSLTKSTNVYWTMLTEADATVDETKKQVILSKNGQTLTLDYSANQDVKVTFEVAKALPQSPEQTDNFVPGKMKMVRIVANGASGDYTLTVKLTPGSVTRASSLADWDKPIAEWNIPDGEIPVAPKINTIYAGERSVDVSKSTSASFTLVEGSAVPTVSVPEGNYTIDIKQATSLTDTAVITLTDLKDPTLKSIYTVTFDTIFAPKQFAGKTSIPVVDFEVSEITEAQNGPINIFDGDMKTRYAVSGVGQWLRVDFGTVQEFDQVALSFMSGHVRRQKFNINISEDGVNWTQVWSGMSSGTTEEIEFYDVGKVKARYIKLDLNGNTEGGQNWNSITEFVVTRSN